MAGKKARKKPVKTPFSAQKLSPAPPSSCNQEAIPSSPPSGEAKNEELPIHPIISSSVKMCRHLEKGVSVDVLSSKLSKARFSITHCQDCAKDSKSGGTKKGKGRSARKKGGALVEQSSPHLHKKWVCLACGHVGCGSLLSRPNKKSEQQESGVDNEKTDVKEEAPMGHASKHARCANHPLALQIGDSLICWCFTCSNTIDCTIDASRPEPASGSTPFHAAVNLVQDRLLKEKGLLKDPGKRDVTEEFVRSDVDDASQSNSSLVLPPVPLISMQRIGTRRKRTVRGLMNLGNTCFFNSVMQNLLALDILRDYFSQEHLAFDGPVTSSLRKLYLETNIDGGQLATSPEAPGYESGLKKGVKGRAGWEMNGGACNPRSLFGAICTKAPRFRGFQQQDSHELLRCLLDGLTSEERSARATKSACNGHLPKGTTAAVPNGVLVPNGDFSKPELSEEERRHQTSGNAVLPVAPTATAVESFFGGQLCSMVRCCECGHSSVVYETMLDLSLQIPTQPTSRRGQKSANQWKPSPFLGGSQQRGGSDTKVSPKESLGKLSNITAAVETNKSTLKAAASAQGSETYPLAAAGASSPKLAPMESSPFDDVWLDFIDCGIQSAESSMQGSADVSNSIETSEKNLVVEIEDCGAKSTLKTASDSSIADTSCQSEPKTELPVLQEPIDCAMSSVGVQNGELCAEGSDADMPESSVEKEVLKPLAHSEGEDGPLPLASGVLLLSYEPLEVPSNSRREESSASCDLAGQCSSMDVSHSPLEADEDLDGFALLFGEEESSSAVTQDVRPSDGTLGGDQVSEESSWDDGIWEADTAADDRNEAACRPQQLANYEGTILPMSLESCLADFTKTELLSGENAWECESCSRHLKEKERSGKNTNNSVTNKAICRSGNLAEPQEGREAANFALSAPGNCTQEDSGRCYLPNTTQNGNTGEGCASLFSENKESRSSICVALDHKVDENQIGSSHFTSSNGGQFYESQSPSCQEDSKSLNGGNIRHSIKEASDMPKSEQANVRDTPDHADNLNVHSSDAEPHVENRAQEDCKSLEQKPVEALPLLGKGKLAGPVSKSVAEAKCRAKSKLHSVKLVKRDATKKLSISKAPIILTVHLKRFAQDMRGRISKLNGHVSFPEYLNLQPFLDPRCLNLDSCYYQLIGVVEHGGTMRGGHYIAYVRNANEEETTDSTEQRLLDSWYYVSDSSVRKASLQAVLNSEAYLLFYEKCEAKKAE